MTPLHSAAGGGHRDVVELLLANRADVNAKAFEGLTPIHMAAFNGHRDVAEFLLSNHAEVKLGTSWGTHLCTGRS